MNSLESKKRYDPDTARLLEGLTLIESEGHSMKQFKRDFLKSCREAKSQVRQNIGYLIEILKDREEELCQKIDEHSLQVMFCKEKSSRDSYLPENSSDDVYSQPSMKVEFVENCRDLEEKLVTYGSIQVETIKKPVDLDTRKNEVPISCFPFPMNIDSPKTFPDSSSSAESFEVISDRVFADSPSKPVQKGFTAGDLIDHIIKSNLTENGGKRLNNHLIQPEIPPAELLFNQMSGLNSATPNKQPSPSTAVRKKFGEYLSDGEQRKRWLASS